jgi:hypothetical protein
MKKDDPTNSFPTKGQLLFGCGNGYDDSNGIITLTDQTTGKIIYKGINYIDCVFKKFSFSVFFYIRRSEKEDIKKKKYFRYIEKIANKAPPNFPAISPDSPEYISFSEYYS